MLPIPEQYLHIGNDLYFLLTFSKLFLLF